MFSLRAVPDCITHTSQSLFGLIDPEGQYAQLAVDIEEQETWIGRVANSEAAEIKLVAIDKCLAEYLDPHKRRCDGALISEKQITLFELKDTKFRQDQDGIGQLEDTISQLDERELRIYTRRVAYVCNRRKPRFAINEKPAMQAFKARTGFRLVLTNEIVLNR